MRTDYVLYAVAVICFGFAVGTYALPLTEARELSLYVLAVVGIVFVGLGYMARPKEAQMPAATTVESPSPAVSSEAPSEAKAEPKEEPEKTTPKKRTRKKTTRRRRKKS